MVSTNLLFWVVDVHSVCQLWCAPMQANLARREGRLHVSKVKLRKRSRKPSLAIWLIKHRESGDSQFRAKEDRDRRKCTLEIKVA